MDAEIREDIIKEARAKVVASFRVYDVPDPYREVILEAFDSKEWDILEMDGCTSVADFWPNKFTPSCTPHDFHYMTGRGGWLSNRLFTEINKCYALAPRSIKIRHTGVTVAWWAFFKWKHLFKGNVKPYTPAMRNALVFYRKNGKLATYKN